MTACFRRTADPEPFRKVARSSVGILGKRHFGARGASSTACWHTPKRAATVEDIDITTGLPVQAADLPIAFTPQSLQEACEPAARLAVRIGSGPLMLRALTGRVDLPSGFTLLG